MPATLIALLAVHVLATLFWLFASFILARSGGAGSEKMFRWQMLAATVAVFSGGGLWSMLHRGAFGPPEMVLTGGALLAIVAAGVQGAMVGGPIRRLRSGAMSQEQAWAKIVKGQRLSAGLLAIALICMVAAPHAGRPFS